MVTSVNNWAILGGTFDPVHIGHLRIALQLRNLGFAHVLLVPNHVPPHRPQPVASGQQRLHMLELACEGLDGVSPCALELERQEPSYSAVTMKLLKERYPQIHFTWVLGSDAWHGFEFWHEPLNLLALANVLVVSRPGAQHLSHWQEEQLSARQCTKEQLFIEQQGRICLLNWPELDISASSLRQALRQGDNIQLLTPDKVLAYIQQQRLYL